MSTLAITVGTGRNRSDIAEAILFSIRTHRPSKVIFLCSQLTKSQTMPIIQQGLTGMAVPYDVVICHNENDVQVLYLEYIEHLRHCRSLMVDFTSGTKAMSAALFAAGIALGAEQVSYVLGPRDATGRVVQSQEVLTFKPDLVLAERQLEKARDLFNQLEFHAAWQLAEAYVKAPPGQTRLVGLAKALYLVGQAYEDWERFDWAKAARTLRKATSPHEGVALASSAMTQIKANITFLQAIAKDAYSSERLYELYANAKRRWEQGRYDDALSRLYRAFEYLIQARLKQWDIDTSKVKLDLLKGKVSESTIRRLCSKADDPLRLGLRDAMELAAELADDVALKLVRTYWRSPWQPGKKMQAKDAGPLQNLLNRRNQSFLAHGTNPVKQEDVKQLLDLYKTILKEALGPKFDDLAQVSRFITL